MILKFIKQNKLISAVIALGVAAVLYLYVFSPPPGSTTHSAIVIVSTTATAPSTDPTDDTSVHFKKYIGTARDPFVPGVSVDASTGAGSNGLGAGGKWQLTGINSINGITSALIENSATNESVFLEVGDRWNNLLVTSIGDDSVNLVNRIGQATQLGFAAPAPPPGQTNNSFAGTGNNTFSATNAPGVNQINPLPPLTPDLGGQTGAPFRPGRGQSSN